MLSYPVLAYKEKGNIHYYGFSVEKKLKTTSQELLHNGVFNSVILIDSTGNRYKVTNVRQVGWANIFFGFSLLRKGRQIEIDFDIEHIDKLSLEDIKKIVLKSIEAKDYYPEITEMIKDANTVSEIIFLFE